MNDSECPQCGNDDIKDELPQEQGSVLSKRFWCGQCGCEWENFYNYAETVITHDGSEEDGE